MAESLIEPAPEQGLDTFGLLAGLTFGLIGVAFLIGGHSAFDTRWNLVLPSILVLLGAVGIGASGVLRRSRNRSVTAEEPVDLEP